MSDPGELSRQLLRDLVDREQIRALKYAYCRYADALDATLMASVFTDDCCVEFRPGLVMRGRAEVEEYYRRAQSVVAASSHHVSNMDIVFDGPDRAAMHTYLYSWQRFDGYPDVRDRHRWARYEDVFVRTREGWRQHQLKYVVQGELAGGDELRVGEALRRPLWTGAATPPPDPGS